MPPAADTTAHSGRAASALDSLARRLGVAGFWRWWLDELAPLVPAGTRAAMRRRRTRPVVAIDGDTATIWQAEIRDGRLAMTEKVRVALAGDASTVASAGQLALAGVARDAERRVVVALPPRQVLRRMITLPAAVEENLRQAVAYDLDRHTPFKPEDLYFDAVLVDRDPARGTVRVDLATVRRSILDQAVRHVESFGGTPVAVVPEPPALAAASRINLLPHDERPTRAWWRQWQLWLPLAVLAIVTAAALLLPLVQKRAYAIALNRATDEARTAAGVSETLRSELDRMVSDYNHVLSRKYQFPSTVEVLDEVTKAMPDDTWLLQMEVKGSPRSKEPQRELLLRGESANAGKLITAIESSNVFTQAAPRSPITKIQPGPGEIFDLAAQVRPLPPPSSPSAAGATPVSATAGSAAAPGATGPSSATTSAGPVPPAAPVASTAPPAGAEPAPPAPSAAAPTPRPSSTAPASAAPPPVPVRPQETGAPPGAAVPAPPPPGPGIAPPRAGGPPASDGNRPRPASGPGEKAPGS